MLPTTRNETATSLTPVSSATMNAIQDCIVGGKRGSFTEFWPAAITTTGAFTIGSPPVQGVSFTGSGQGLIIPLRYPLGTSINAARGAVTDASGTTVRCSIVEKIIGSGVTIYTSSPTAGTGLLQNPVVTINPTITVVTGRMYYALYTFGSGSATSTVWGVEVDTTRP